MAKKIKSKVARELSDNADTAALFDPAEAFSFLITDYSNYRTALYLGKVHERGKNPRLTDLGAENLNEQSMVADIDMMPLTTKQNISRFTQMPSAYDGDGYDTDDSDDNDDHFNAPDRSDNPPSPHEIRARDLDRKLSKARAAHTKAREAALEKSATPPPKAPSDEAPKPPNSVEA